MAAFPAFSPPPSILQIPLLATIGDSPITQTTQPIKHPLPYRRFIMTSSHSKSQQMPIHESPPFSMQYPAGSI
ncbi:uncharacterized protein BDW70DRAFT_128338 [Aspergillus foveolatus]|uniref:uncharacterized protein n=1 Tax=Aspergillus foveolatus TaxID=210207 RepID=UPI003CCE1704